MLFNQWRQSMSRGLLVVIPICFANGFSLLEKSRIPGIWKLVVDVNSRELLRDQRDDVSRIRAQVLAVVIEKEQKDEEILLKLNPDGSFRQCSEGIQEGCWVSGRWMLKNDNGDNDAQLLLLALDRQYFGPRQDILLEGTLERDEASNSSSSSNAIVRGRVTTGKFMYPKKHPFFFDESLVSCMKNVAGTFSMQQAVASCSAMLSPSKRSGDMSVGRSQLFEVSDETLMLLDEDEHDGRRSVFE
jgi:hypothetical protein